MRNTKPKTIPNSLKRYRKARGLQQKEVAKILGIKSASMISRWEKGRCLPSALNLFRLAVVYRTMVDALYIDLLRASRADLHEREQRILRRKTAK
jgi:transcriptional regulator with XRE-family HTH domain